MRLCIDYASTEQQRLFEFMRKLIEPTYILDLEVPPQHKCLANQLLLRPPPTSLILTGDITAADASADVASTADQSNVESVRSIFSLVATSLNSLRRYA